MSRTTFLGSLTALVTGLISAAAAQIENLFAPLNPHNSLAFAGARTTVQGWKKPAKKDYNKLTAASMAHQVNINAGGYQREGQHLVQNGIVT